MSEEASYQFTVADIAPLQDRVIVRQLKQEELEPDSYTLIETPDDTKQRPSVGEVLAVGPGRVLETGVIIKPSVQVGDLVLFGLYTGTELPEVSDVKGDIIKVMREDEIFARVRKQA